MFYLPIWSENYLHYLTPQVVRKYHRFWCHFWCHHGCTGEVSMVGQCVYVQIQFFWKGPVECTETSGTKLWRFSVWLCMERSQKQLFRNLQRYANGLPFYHDFASKLESMLFCSGWRLLLHIQCNSTQGKSCQSRVNTIIYVPIYPCAMCYQLNYNFFNFLQDGWLIKSIWRLWRLRIHWWRWLWKSFWQYLSNKSIG